MKQKVKIVILHFLGPDIVVYVQAKDRINTGESLFDLKKVHGQ